MSTMSYLQGDRSTTEVLRLMRKAGVASITFNEDLSIKEVTPRGILLRRTPEEVKRNVENLLSDETPLEPCHGRSFKNALLVAINGFYRESQKESGVFPVKVHAGNYCVESRFSEEQRPDDGMGL